MNQFSHYPYQNFSDYNLDWLMQLVKKINEKLSEYLENSVITFADPIQWDITAQYTALTCVVDSDGTAYLSKQPVPAGVDISNTDYWMPIFNYNDVLNNIRSEIAVNDGMSETAIADHEDNTLVWVNGVLYKTLTPIVAGDRYVVGGNIAKITVADFFNMKYIEADETIEFPNGLYIGSGDITASGDVHVYRPLSKIIIDSKSINVRDNAAHTLIANETNARQQAYSALDTAITNETTAREAAVSALNTALANEITNETTAREAAVSALNTALANEITARSNGDTVLQNQIDSAASRINSIETRLTANQIVVVSDSYATGVGTAVTDSFVNIAKTELSGLITIYNCSKGGCGFGNASPYNYYDALTETESIIPDKTKIDEVWIIGGHNDLSYSVANMQANAAQLVNYIRANYPNAKINICAIGMTLNENLTAAWYTLPDKYAQLANYTNCAYVRGLEKVLSNSTLMNADSIHPSQGGQNALAAAFKNAVLHEMPAIYQSIGSDGLTITGGDVSYTQPLQGYWTRYNDRAILYNTQTGFKPVMEGYLPANGTNMILLGTLTKTMYFGNPIIYEFKHVPIILESGGNYYQGNGAIRFSGSRVFLYPLVLLASGGYANYDANCTIYLLPNTLEFEL